MRNLAKNYLGSLWQNYYTDREGKDTREREKRDETKTGINEKISQDKKS